MKRPELVGIRALDGQHLDGANQIGNYSATRCSQPFSEKHQMLCFGKNHSGNFQKIVKQITPSQQSEKCNPLFYNVVSFSLIG